MFLSEFKKDGLKNDFYCLFIAYQNMMNHTKAIQTPISIIWVLIVLLMQVLQPKFITETFDWNHMWKSFPGSTTMFWRRDTSVRTVNYSQQSEAEMLNTNSETMLLKVSLNIPDGCYNDMQNPKNTKMPQTSTKVCIITFNIVTRMNKCQPSLIIFSIFTFLESVLIMKISAPSVTWQ